MTIKAKVIEDSIHNGHRITTIEVRYPYIIHGQLLTHRVFSRNSQSNRAIPTIKVINTVLDDPYTPVFRANKPGMVAGDQVSQTLPRIIWSLARRSAVIAAKLMVSCGVHKETTNRLLLPFMHVTTLVTSTEWDNFFELRIEDNAQPEIQELAASIQLAMYESIPRELGPGEWHLPYVNEEERAHPHARRISVARCARVSYLNHDKTKPSVVKDLGLYHDLITSKPIHGSPAEHQATPITTGGLGITHWDNEGVPHSNNFKYWGQNRAIIE